MLRLLRLIKIDLYMYFLYTPKGVMIYATLCTAIIYNPLGLMIYPSLSAWIKNPPSLVNQGFSGFFGGDKRDRTADLLNAIQALSQLSYTPKDKCYYIKCFCVCQPIIWENFKKVIKNMINPLISRVVYHSRLFIRLTSVRGSVKIISAL